MWEVISFRTPSIPADGQLWTLGKVVEKRVQHLCQNANGEYYAVITLRVEPYNGAEGVVFINAAPASYDFAIWQSETEKDCVISEYIEGVITGVREALEEKEKIGFPLTNLLITLTELRIHPVDSYPKAFQRAAVMAMNQSLEHDNLILTETI